MCGAHEQCHAMVALNGRLLCIKYAHQTLVSQQEGHCMTLLTWLFDDVLTVEVAVSVVSLDQDNNVFVYTLSPISLMSCLSTNRTRVKCISPLFHGC